VVGDEVFLNYLWLPGFVWFNQQLQQQIGALAVKKYREKHGRYPKTTEEDLDELDRFVVKAFAEAFPGKGVRKFVQALADAKPELTSVIPDLGKSFDNYNETEKAK
jgi:hypothetical protein